MEESKKVKSKDGRIPLSIVRPPADPNALPTVCPRCKSAYWNRAKKVEASQPAVTSDIPA
ncbi:MAG: hypothetical protein HYY22_01970 [Thaumarchaeota archaeon]|nr:hypothetical protein [Nitrososphaerota archaeon]